MLWWIPNCHNLIDCLIVKWNEILKQEKIYSKAIIVIAKLCAMALIPPISPPMIFVRKKNAKSDFFFIVAFGEKEPQWCRWSFAPLTHPKTTKKWVGEKVIIRMHTRLSASSKYYGALSVFECNNHGCMSRSIFT